MVRMSTDELLIPPQKDVGVCYKKEIRTVTDQTLGSPGQSLGLTMWNKAKNMNRACAVECMMASAVYPLLHVLHPCLPPWSHCFNTLQSLTVTLCVVF